MDYSQLPQLKSETIPYYVQIYDIIYELIREKKLKAGDILPGENILASHWNVSRSTVRMAIRKLAEDGYIYKMRGKNTTVTGAAEGERYGLQQIGNPCINCCIEKVTSMETKISIQDGGKLVGDRLGYGEKFFTAVAVDVQYFVNGEQVASSVMVLPIMELENMGISVGEIGKIRELALYQIYEKAKHSQLSVSVMEWAEEEKDKPACPILVVMDEVLYGVDGAVSYHKYWMDSNWYRFLLDRRH